MSWSKRIPDSALFIFAHPDDIEYSVAGTAAKWIKYGSEVYYLLLTGGKPGETIPPDLKGKPENNEVRKKEQIEAGKVVGVKGCLFLNEPDGLLTPSLENRKNIVRYIRKLKPDTVVCDDPRNFFSSELYINHPDHRAAGILALESVFPASQNETLYPDLVAEGLHSHQVKFVYINTSKNPNCFIDISETIDIKIQALKLHVSQIQNSRIDDQIHQSARWQGKKVGLRYAESFFCIKCN